MRRIFFLSALTLFACPPEPAGECVSAADCNDNNACTTDSCDASQCNNVNINIDDQISCTDDSCDPATGTISHTPQNNNCDDAVGCTVDVCDVVNDCQNTPDDNLCNGTDICSAVNDCQPGGGSNPVINSVFPNNGVASVGTNGVLLTGDDLLPGAVVTFGGVAASCQNVNTPTQLLCDVPAGNVGRVDVAVSNPDNQSFTASNAFTHTGVLNETDQAAELDFCVLQFPFTLTATANQVSEVVFGRFFESGLTDATFGQAAPGVTAELGFGPLNSSPTNDSSWRFSAAAFNVETGFNNNDDEYQGTLTIPTAGTFSYTYRFSLDGGINFTYCDQSNGANGGDGGSGANGGLVFESNQLGTVTVQ